jgi:hypothetical protein
MNYDDKYDFMTNILIVYLVNIQNLLLSRIQITCQVINLIDS